MKRFENRVFLPVASTNAYLDGLYGAGQKVV